MGNLIQHYGIGLKPTVGAEQVKARMEGDTLLVVDGHGHCQLPECQWPEAQAFIEKFLLGRPADTSDVRIVNVKGPDF